jgi:hypothetical protein
VRKTHDYIHCYRGYWSDGGKCRIRIYQEDGQSRVVTWERDLLGTDLRSPEAGSCKKDPL